MKKKEIVALFEHEMGPFFEAWGFKFLKSRMIAEKKEGPITKTIYFQADYFLGKAAVFPHLWLRHEHIMAIRAELYPRYAKHFSNIIMDTTHLCKHYNLPALDFVVDDLGDNDLGSYIYEKTMPYYKEKFVHFMEHCGNPHFENFYIIRDFDKWFNKDLFEHRHSHSNMDLQHIPIWSIISAYLVNRPELEEIENYWMSRISIEKYKKEFVEMAEHLKRRKR